MLINNIHLVSWQNIEFVILKIIFSGVDTVDLQNTAYYARGAKSLSLASPV